MNEISLSQLMEDVKAGRVTIQEAVERLRQLPYEDLGFARLDHHREIRTGSPEVIFCQGKAADHLVKIFERLFEKNNVVLGTRASAEQADLIKAKFPQTVYHELGRCLTLGELKPPINPERYVLVVSAGTADLPVAEEAAITAHYLGSRVERLYDVGVAGLHRLLDQTPLLFEASVIIVAAGMEGALASVVGGLVGSPVIAVPTSIGYGASFEGLAALLAMLNTCAPGVVTVNIDNGFGAGYFAHIVNQK
ncbi:MAG: nickel pincer cofactor biosynthesis protein LarB [bacterium]